MPFIWNSASCNSSGPFEFQPQDAQRLFYYWFGNIDADLPGGGHFNQLPGLSAVIESGYPDIGIGGEHWALSDRDYLIPGGFA
jgi:hypothetical protein